jgi:hypothetical protein
MFRRNKRRSYKKRLVMPDEEMELERAAQHVAAGKRIVAQQHERIATLKAAGHPVEEHERLLKVFAHTLEALEAHHRLLLREIAKARQNNRGR